MLSFSFTQFATIAAIVTSALAHMDVADPPPLRSKHNKQYAGGNVDFDMTSPLSNDGSNFPCKGYHTDVPGTSTAVATLKAGEKFTVTMEGSASHGGGSCQFSISYDNAKTWGVLHNEVGGCMLAASYSFDVPANLPSADNVLLSWTWFNRVGNREMYQNCMAVDVEGSGSAPVSLSKMFVANIGNGCVTKEGTDIDFANPAAGLQDGCSPITPDQKVSIGPNGSSSGGGGGAAPAPAPSSSNTDGKPTATSTEAPAPTSTDAPEEEDDCPPETDDGSDDDESDDGADDEEEDCPPETDDEPTSTSAPSAPAPSADPEPAPAPAPAPSEAPSTGGSGGSCSTPGASLCSADGLSWSMCANGAYVPMGAVAPGTKCVDGKHVSINKREHSPSGLRRRYMRLAMFDQ